jgi:hypothetical protein
MPHARPTLNRRAKVKHFRQAAAPGRVGKREAAHKANKRTARTAPPSPPTAPPTPPPPPPAPPSDPLREALTRLVNNIDQKELPLANNLIQHVIQTTTPETKPIDLVEISDADRVAYLNKLDPARARRDGRYLQALRQVQQHHDWQASSAAMRSVTTRPADADLHDAAAGCNLDQARLTNADLHGAISFTPNEPTHSHTVKGRSHAGRLTAIERSSLNSARLISAQMIGTSAKVLTSARPIYRVL